jgi:hypothetical protein
MPTALIRNNFPQDFTECPNCGKKGWYRYTGRTWQPGGKNAPITGTPPGKRCKYCKHRVQDVSTAEFLAIYNKPKPDDRERLMDIARGAIEQNLDTEAYLSEDEDGAADAIYSEAYALGYGALIEAGVEATMAGDIARYVAQGYAQP